MEEHSVKQLVRNEKYIDFVHKVNKEFVRLCGYNNLINSVEGMEDRNSTYWHFSHNVSNIVYHLVYLAKYHRSPLFSKCRRAHQEYLPRNRCR